MSIKNSNIVDKHEVSYTCKNSFFFLPVTPGEIVSIINSLKSKNNKTKDRIPTQVFKHCKENLSEILSEFVNLSFSSGTFPQACKIAKIVPIFKGGDASDPNNYRPIAILSSLSKIIEKCVYSLLVRYLETNKLLHAYQYGFRKNSNTQNAAVDIVSKVQSALDRNHLAAGLFIDLKKAFDTVDHMILLKKTRTNGS